MSTLEASTKHESQKILSPALASLVHHITLSDAGWHSRTLRHLVEAALWTDDNGMSADVLREHLVNEFGITLTGTELQQLIDEMETDGVLQHSNGSQYRLTEASRHTLDGRIDESDHLEQRVQSLFEKLVEANCRDVEHKPSWEHFKTSLLLPLIADLGARTYQLITGQSGTFEDAHRLKAFLDGAKMADRSGLRSMIGAFLSPSNADVRRYVLRQLNAHFCVAASRLSPATLDTLAELSKQTLNVKLLIDTNFLYSFLGLDETSSQEVAQTLIGLIEHAAQRVTVELYVTKATLAEAQANLRDQMNTLRKLRVTPNVAHAAQSSHLSGVARRFIHECQRLRKPLSAEMYFEPYLSNLLRLLQDKGFELFNADLEKIEESTEVQADIQRQLQHEQHRYGTGAKPRSTLTHDILLWHIASSRRGPVVESPIEAGFWVCTLDWRLLRFDAFKRQSDHAQVPVCIHPTALIQMLQFWVPRTESFERAMLDSVRMPFLAEEFSADDERLTLTILEHLSRFENIGDLPTETISHVLLNTALRQRLDEKGPDEQLQLIKDELLEIHSQTKQQLDQANRHVGEKDSQIRELHGALAKSQAKESETATKLAATQSDLGETDAVLSKLRRDHGKLQSNLAAEVDRSGTLERRIAALETVEAARIDRIEQRRARLRFLGAWFGLLCAVAAVGGVAGAVIASLITWPLSRSLLVCYAILLAVWVFGCAQAGARNPRMRTWSPFRVFRRFHKWLAFGLIGSLLYGVLGNLATDWVKKVRDDTRLRSNEAPAP